MVKTLKRWHPWRKFRKKLLTYKNFVCVHPNQWNKSPFLLEGGDRLKDQFRHLSPISQEGLFHREDVVALMRVCYHGPRSKRQRVPLVFHKTFWSQLLQKYLTIKLTENGLNHIQNKGGIDKYILTSAPEAIWSHFGETLRYEMADMIKNYESQVWLHALNGDKNCLEYAYHMCVREEGREGKAKFVQKRTEEQKNSFPFSLRQQFVLQHLSNEVQKYMNYMNDDEQQKKFNPLLMDEPTESQLRPDGMWMRVAA